MKRLLCLAPVIAAAALAQTNSAITREGGYWVETVTGSAAVETALTVSTTGSVQLHGENRTGNLAYTLKRRARAANEVSARHLFERVYVKTTTKPGATFLDVVTPDPGRVMTDLQLRVPRGLRGVAVVTAGGSVVLSGVAGSARAETAGGAVTVDDIGGAAAVRTGGGAVTLGRIGGKLDCYSGGGSITADSVGGEASFSTGGGQIVVREAKAPVVIKSLGGNIRVERALKGVRVAAGSGLIDVADAGGPVIAETGSGSIKVISASDVRCETGGGMLQLHAVSGELRASTRMGAIVADLSGAGKLRDSSLATTSGDITVFIPSNLPVTVEAISNSPGARRIISDFPEIRLQSAQGRSEAHGSLNGGGPVLRLAVTNGMIYVRRQK